MIKLTVAGATGRMGKMILGLAGQEKVFKVTGGLEFRKHPELGRDLGEVTIGKKLGVPLSGDPLKALAGANVLIDFTHPTATMGYVKAALKTKTGLVIGTTGLKTSHLAAIKQAARRIPIVQAPNMSVGVNLLYKLSRLVAEVLDENYDIEIVETHHRMKKDAPSGTALKLLEEVAAARRKSLTRDVVYGRHGEPGARPRGEISVLALRGGDVVGDHQMHYLGDGERLELTHRASSREAFARGALRAARFIAKRPKGLFTMQQVLGLA